VNFKGGLLLDESVSLGDISISSFETPLPAEGALGFDDSPITQPRFTAGDDESEEEQDVAPRSPLDDKVPAEPTEADEDIAPPDLPPRRGTPSPGVNPEPQTPSRRPKMQITLETEGVVVRARVDHS
jgi:hypothetical protein